MSARGHYDEYGDFHLPFVEQGVNAPGEIHLTGDLGKDDEPIVSFSFTATGEGVEDFELRFGTFRVEATRGQDFSTQLSTSAILTAADAAELADALKHLTRPRESS